MNAVDANVLVYAFDDDEPIKQAKANELLDRLLRSPGNTITLWQAAAEFLAVLRKWQDSGHITEREVQENLRDVLNMFPLRLPRKRIFNFSLDLRSRFSLSHWDGMLIAACKDGGIDVLYSEDMADGADYDGVRIENPFP
jgi:predicted nucleic acid-binding protein